MRGNNELKDQDYAALAEFRHLIRTFQAFSEQRAAEHGLKPQQHQALLAIRGAGDAPVTIGYVAERLVIRPHSASGLIDRLEVLDLVARKPSPDDARQMRVGLTPKARKLLATLSATHREEIARLRPMLFDLLQAIA